MRVDFVQIIQLAANVTFYADKRLPLRTPVPLTDGQGQRGVCAAHSFEQISSLADVLSLHILRFDFLKCSATK
jgi:hypothetical protein